MKTEKEQKIIKLFCEKNPNIDDTRLMWRMDGRLEWICEHGIGHTVYSPDGEDDWGFIHGCDGCCGKINTISNSELGE